MTRNLPVPEDENYVIPSGYTPQLHPHSHYCGTPRIEREVTSYSDHDLVLLTCASCNEVVIVQEFYDDSTVWWRNYGRLRT